MNSNGSKNKILGSLNRYESYLKSPDYYDGLSTEGFWHKVGYGLSKARYAVPVWGQMQLYRDARYGGHPGDSIKELNKISRQIDDEKLLSADGKSATLESLEKFDTTDIDQAIGRIELWLKKNKNREAVDAAAYEKMRDFYVRLNDLKQYEEAIINTEGDNTEEKIKRHKEHEVRRKHLLSRYYSFEERLDISEGRLNSEIDDGFGNKIQIKFPRGIGKEVEETMNETFQKVSNKVYAIYNAGFEELEKDAEKNKDENTLKELEKLKKYFNARAYMWKLLEEKSGGKLKVTLDSYGGVHPEFLDPNYMFQGFPQDAMALTQEQWGFDSKRIGEEIAAEDAPKGQNIPQVNRDEAKKRVKDFLDKHKKDALDSRKSDIDFFLEEMKNYMDASLGTDEQNKGLQDKIDELKKKFEEVKSGKVKDGDKERNTTLNDYEKLLDEARSLKREVCNGVRDFDKNVLNELDKDASERELKKIDMLLDGNVWNDLRNEIKNYNEDLKKYEEKLKNIEKSIPNGNIRFISDRKELHDMKNKLEIQHKKILESENYQNYEKVFEVYTRKKSVGTETKINDNTTFNAFNNNIFIINDENSLRSVLNQYETKDNIKVTDQNNKLDLNNSVNMVKLEKEIKKLDQYIKDMEKTGRNFYGSYTKGRLCRIKKILEKGKERKEINKKLYDEVYNINIGRNAAFGNFFNKLHDIAPFVDYLTPEEKNELATGDLRRIPDGYAIDLSIGRKKGDINRALALIGNTNTLSLIDYDYNNNTNIQNQSKIEKFMKENQLTDVDLVKVGMIDKIKKTVKKAKESGYKFEGEQRQAIWEAFEFLNMGFDDLIYDLADDNQRMNLSKIRDLSLNDLKSCTHSLDKIKQKDLDTADKRPKKEALKKEFSELNFRLDRDVEKNYATGINSDSIMLESSINLLSYIIDTTLKNHINGTFPIVYNPPTTTVKTFVDDFYKNVTSMEKYVNDNQLQDHIEIKDFVEKSKKLKEFADAGTFNSANSTAKNYFSNEFKNAWNVYSNSVQNFLAKAQNLNDNKDYFLSGKKGEKIITDAKYELLKKELFGDDGLKYMLTNEDFLKIPGVKQDDNITGFDRTVDEGYYVKTDTGNYHYLGKDLKYDPSIGVGDWKNNLKKSLKEGLTCNIPGVGNFVSIAKKSNEPGKSITDIPLRFFADNYDINDPANISDRALMSPGGKELKVSWLRSKLGRNKPGVDTTLPKEKITEIPESYFYTEGGKKYCLGTSLKIQNDDSEEIKRIKLKIQSKEIKKEALENTNAGYYFKDKGGNYFYLGDDAKDIENDRNGDSNVVKRIKEDIRNGKAKGTISFIDDTQQHGWEGLDPNTKISKTNKAIESVFYLGLRKTGDKHIDELFDKEFGTHPDVVNWIDDISRKYDIIENHAISKEAQAEITKLEDEKKQLNNEKLAAENSIQIAINKINDSSATNEETNKAKAEKKECENTIDKNKKRIKDIEKRLVKLQDKINNEPEKIREAKESLNNDINLKRVADINRAKNMFESLKGMGMKLKPSEEQILESKAYTFHDLESLHRDVLKVVKNHEKDIKTVFDYTKGNLYSDTNTRIPLDIVAKIEKGGAQEILKIVPDIIKKNKNLLQNKKIKDIEKAGNLGLQKELEKAFEEVKNNILVRPELKNSVDSLKPVLNVLQKHQDNKKTLNSADITNIITLSINNKIKWNGELFNKVIEMAKDKSITEFTLNGMLKVTAPGSVATNDQDKGYLIPNNFFDKYQKKFSDKAGEEPTKNNAYYVNELNKADSKADFANTNYNEADFCQNYGSQIGDCCTNVPRDGDCFMHALACRMESGGNFNLLGNSFNMAAGNMLQNVPVFRDKLNEFCKNKELKLTSIKNLPDGKKNWVDVEEGAKLIATMQKNKLFYNNLPAPDQGEFFIFDVEPELNSAACYHIKNGKIEVLNCKDGINAILNAEGVYGAGSNKVKVISKNGTHYMPVAYNCVNQFCNSVNDLLQNKNISAEPIKQSYNMRKYNMKKEKTGQALIDSLDKKLNVLNGTSNFAGMNDAQKNFINEQKSELKAAIEKAKIGSYEAALAAYKAYKEQRDKLGLKHDKSTGTKVLKVR